MGCTSSKAAAASAHVARPPQSTSPPILLSDRENELELEIKRLRKENESLHTEKARPTSPPRLLNDREHEMELEMNRLRKENETLQAEKLEKACKGPESQAEEARNGETTRLAPAKKPEDEPQSGAPMEEPADGLHLPDTEDEAQRQVERERDNGEVGFYFVDADFLRKTDWETLPSQQTLWLKHKDVLVKRTLKTKDAYRGAYTSDISAVSHRWETPEEPDTMGIQLQEIKEYLKSGPGRGVKLLWFDFWCMPQGEGKTKAEKIYFKWMLGNVNMLYMGASILLLVDISYLSRFWTQFEAWLSMQSCTRDGLVPAVGSPHLRCTIKCIHNATAGSEDKKLLDMWAQRTPQEAFNVLRRPDVTVTNTSDKEGQLGKVRSLDEQVCTAFNVESATDLRLAGVSATELLAIGFSSETTLAAGYALPQLKDAGFKGEQLQKVGIDLDVGSAAQLREGGAPASSLREFGYSCGPLSHAGYTMLELMRAGYSGKELEAGGLSLNAESAVEMRKAGVGAAELLNGGYPCASLSTAGYTVGDLLNAGCSAAQLKEASITFTPEQLKAEGAAAGLAGLGCTVEQLVSAGFTYRELSQAGFSASLMRESGVTLRAMMTQASESGVDLRQMVTAADGSSVKDFSGYTPEQLNAGGFTVDEMWDYNNWFELNELFRAGCDKTALVKKLTYQTDRREGIGPWTQTKDPDKLIWARTNDARVLRRAGFEGEFTKHLRSSNEFPIQALVDAEYSMRDFKMGGYDRYKLQGYQDQYGHYLDFNDWHLY